MISVIFAPLFDHSLSGLPQDFEEEIVIRCFTISLHDLELALSSKSVADHPRLFDKPLNFDVQVTLLPTSGLPQEASTAPCFISCHSATHDRWGGHWTSTTPTVSFKNGMLLCP